MFYTGFDDRVPGKQSIGLATSRNLFDWKRHTGNPVYEAPPWAERRADGWVEHGLEKIEKMKPIAEKHGLTLVQFAAIWNLSQPAVESVVPTFIQEAGEGVRSIEDRIRDFAALPEVRLSAEEVEQVRRIGDNTGCMALKGASKRHEVSERPDEWPMRDDLLELAGRHGLGTEW
jgi:hypothetical protein